MTQFLLTKTHFRHYLEAPMHLWAAAHALLPTQVSAFGKGMQRQAYEVEELALSFLRQRAPAERYYDLPREQLSFTDGSFFARADLIVQYPDKKSADLYEVKAASELKPDHILDCAFQYLVISASQPLRKVFLVLLDASYIREKELDLDRLFRLEDVTDAVLSELDNVEQLRQNALRTALQDTPKCLAHCYKPKECPCPQLCHPWQTPLTIYEIPGLTRSRKEQLEALDVVDAREVPDDFPLNEKQRKVVQVARAGDALVESAAIRRKLKNLHYPLQFLDYETYNSAVPLFAGYRPYQDAVFQFSLDRLESENAPVQHIDYLCLELLEPSLGLLSALRDALWPKGSVLVWNKSFEMARNKEMAALHPEFSGFLEDLNSRIVDLADSFKEGLYLHPEFKGSWSIKKVLPVIDPDAQRYTDMEIGEGTEASEAWWEMLHSDQADVRAKLQRDLRQYCALDTEAMLRVYHKLSAVSC